MTNNEADTKTETTAVPDASIRVAQMADTLRDAFLEWREKQPRKT